MKNEWQEKNKIINPRMSGYNDRKMAKWQGLILSEHSEAMNQSKEKNKKINDQKEKQSLENISKLIAYSYSQKKTVSIQVDCLFNCHYEDDLIGIVCGYHEDTIYIQTEDELVVCELNLIRNVEKNEEKKWFKN